MEITGNFLMFLWLIDKIWVGGSQGSWWDLSNKCCIMYRMHVNEIAIMTMLNHRFLDR